MKKLEIWSEPMKESFEKREAELATAAVMALVALGAVVLINATTDARLANDEATSPTDA